MQDGIPQCWKDFTKQVDDLMAGLSAANKLGEPDPYLASCQEEMAYVIGRWMLDIMKTRDTPDPVIVEVVAHLMFFLMVKEAREVGNGQN